MANLNPSPVSRQAFTLPPGDSGMSVSSQQRRSATWPRTAVLLAAWLEIIVGVSFLLALNVQSQFLFGGTPEGIGVLFGRFSGIGLIGMGLACLPSNHAGTSQGAARSLFVFNIGATIFFAWVAVATTFRGVLLWPVVILHAVVSIALALSLRNEEE